MSRVLPVLVLMIASAAPAAADEAKPITAAQIVATLHDGRLNYEKDLRTTPFLELLEDLEKQHKLKFIVSTAKFDSSVRITEMRAESLTAKDLNGMCLHAALKAYLAALPLEDATYVVRPDHIEITSLAAVREELGLGETESSDAAPSRINLPIVCVAAREKQLSTVLDDLRRVYGINVVVESAVKPQLKHLITIQLLNVPADTALELLAGQADLGVVRKGNTFRIISNPKG